LLDTFQYYLNDFYVLPEGGAKIHCFVNIASDKI
jgi:hypothetical protein